MNDIPIPVGIIAILVGAIVLLASFSRWLRMKLGVHWMSGPMMSRISLAYMGGTAIVFGIAILTGEVLLLIVFGILVVFGFVVEARDSNGDRRRIKKPTGDHEYSSGEFSATRQDSIYPELTEDKEEEEERGGSGGLE